MAKGHKKARAKKSGSKSKRRKAKRKNPARRVPVLVANPVRKKTMAKAKRKKKRNAKRGSHKGKRAKKRNPSHGHHGGHKKKRGRRRRRHNPGLDVKKTGMTILKVVGGIALGLGVGVGLNYAPIGSTAKMLVRGGAAIVAIGVGAALDAPLLGAATGVAIAYPAVRDGVSMILPTVSLGDMGKVILGTVQVRQLPNGRMMAHLPDGRTMGMVELRN